MTHWREAIISPEQSLFLTIENIDRSVLQIALVLAEDGRLLGTVTDGDIRRAILKGITMDQPVETVMNRKPYCVAPDYDRDELKATMITRRFHQVPVIDEGRRVVDLVVIDDVFKNGEKHENWVVLMAGGLGTRLRPLTDTMPKPLIEVGGKPLLESILVNFIAQGFKRFYISVNYKRELIQDYFGDGGKWGVEIRYLNEEKSLGTAGALSLIEQEFSNPLIVMNGDLITDVNFSKLLAFHEAQGAVATMGVREYDFQVQFGVVSIKDNEITAINEKPVHRFLVNGGIYVLNASVLCGLKKGNAIDMPALFEELILREAKCLAFPIHEYWLDIGRIEDLRKAQQKVRVVDVDKNL